MRNPDGSTARMLGVRLKPSTITKNPNIVNCDNGWLEMVKVKAQIRTLYEAVNKLNADFWPALVNPVEHLKAKPMSYSTGSVEQVQLALQFTYEAWGDIPGAIAVIEMCIEGKI
ncbi:unnamed protein product [Penicillium egyptiacum]|uniref:Uncharacterized protein n=1 Tax=Penicillium egyptiacum TaxID=1303716 RepID=A0A9W4PAH4_9EURO|nr:unnamed protein product [Penicillium egyptiacum]